jgi:hypothetical protein
MVHAFAHFVLFSIGHTIQLRPVITCVPSPRIALIVSVREVAVGKCPSFVDNLWISGNRAFPSMVIQADVIGFCSIVGKTINARYAGSSISSTCVRLRVLVQCKQLRHDSSTHSLHSNEADKLWGNGLEPVRCLNVPAEASRLLLLRSSQK